MARIRSVKPEFFTDDDVASLPFEARLLFIGMWTQADRAGRLEDRPRRLKAVVFPYDDVDVEAMLEQLVTVGFIVRYSVQGKDFIAIRSFEKHQCPNVKEPESTIPAPYEHSAGTVRARARARAEGKGKEGKGKEGSRTFAPSSSAKNADDSPPPPAVFSIPCTKGVAYGVTEEQIAAWTATFPAVDVRQQLRAMVAWADANPAKRKTLRGSPAFVVRWLTREQDKPRRVEHADKGDPSTVRVDPPTRYQTRRERAEQELAWARRERAHIPGVVEQHERVLADLIASGRADETVPVA